MGADHNVPPPVSQRRRSAGFFAPVGAAGRLDCLTVRSRNTVAAVALLAGCWLPAGIARADPAQPAPPPLPGPIHPSIDKDGTYKVGTDISPGTYSSPGPAGTGVCYWRRVSGDTVVDNAMSKKPQIVQIDATDTSFKTSDCQPWQKIEDCLPGCAPAGANPMDVLGQLGNLMLQHPGGPPTG
jgi:hypothetical protein